MKPEGGWDDDKLGELFADTSLYLNTYTPKYDYTPVVDPTSTSTGGPAPTNTGETSENKGFPSYIPPLLGTLLGLFCVISVLGIVLFILKRRKWKLKQARSETEGSSVRRNRQTWSWLLGVYGDEKGAESTRGEPLGLGRPGHMRNFSNDTDSNTAGASGSYKPSAGVGYTTAKGHHRSSVLKSASPVTEIGTGEGTYSAFSELGGTTIHEMAGVYYMIGSMLSVDVIRVLICNVTE